MRSDRWPRNVRQVVFAARVGATCLARSTVRLHPKANMSSRRNSKSVTLKSAQLSVAVPQVVAHRITRMAIAGAPMSERDRKEFKRMVDEKKVAFTEAVVAMAAQTARANQALAMSMLRSFWSSLRRGPSPVALAAQLQGAALGVLAKGMAPVHRKAVANAKRLAKTKLR